MDWDRVITLSLEQVSYYNNYRGWELEPVFHGPSRARLANIAACMVDGQRFQCYLTLSAYWETDLITAARCYVAKPELGDWIREPEEFQAFLRELRERLLVQVPRKRIYRNPQRLNYRLDIPGVTQMLRQIWLAEAPDG